mmetsp:Transcript_33810/g.87910  ORF Transcript_33810/g.87910 Transcript_33810/m.87910 type:complete len:329 (-) Transcript_33810:134-1120(-)
MLTWSVIRPFLMVFGGCMSSIVSMEYILQIDPSAGNLVTCTEFVFVMLQSLPQYVTVKSGGIRFAPRLASDQAHLMHGAVWVSMSVLVNVAYGYNITVPIHTLFRSCNVVSSVIVGWLFFGVTYGVSQLFSVVLVTCGIFLATIGDASVLCVHCDGGILGALTNAKEDMRVWAVGIAILLLVLFLQAFLGHLQRIFYDRYPGTSDEFMFFSHVYALIPTFLMAQGLVKSLSNLAASQPISPLVPVPSGLVYLLANNITQSVCIRGVFALSAVVSPLSVCNRALALEPPLIWFNNPWTGLHSLATLCIFGGSSVPILAMWLSSKKEKEQ